MILNIGTVVAAARKQWERQIEIIAGLFLGGKSSDFGEFR